MNPFAASNLAVALRRLDNALAYLEQHADGGPPSLLGLAYSDLRAVRGCLVAAEQLEHLEATLGRAPTEPPPALRVVR